MGAMSQARDYGVLQGRQIVKRGFGTNSFRDSAFHMGPLPLPVISQSPMHNP